MLLKFLPNLILMLFLKKEAILNYKEFLLMELEKR